MRYLDYLLFNTVHMLLNPVLQAFAVSAAVFIFVVGLDEKTIPESLVFALSWLVVIWIVEIAFYAALLISKKEDANLTEHVLELRDDVQRFPLSPGTAFEIAVAGTFHPPPGKGDEQLCR